MSYADVAVGQLCADELVLNPAETAARLGTSRDFRHERVDECLAVLRANMRCRYAYARMPVAVEGDVCDFGFMQVQSRALGRNLDGCAEAYIFAVTLGAQVDRLLMRLAAVSQSDRFITDALASSAAESLCECVSRQLAAGLRCRPRFSPGYGDFSINFQPLVLDRLNAGSYLGITLTDALMMVPSKSITAVMGIAI